MSGQLPKASRRPPGCHLLHADQCRRCARARSEGLGFSRSTDGQQWTVLDHHTDEPTSDQRSKRRPLPSPIARLQKFWATEAALSLTVLTYNLTVLFHRHLAWLKLYDVKTLRQRLLGSAAILNYAKGETTLKFGSPPPQRSWRRKVGENPRRSPQLQCSWPPAPARLKKVRSPYPILGFNCMDTAK
jgi:predicted Fe-S protein YdhL (DUF1289 family)